MVDFFGGEFVFVFSSDECFGVVDVTGDLFMECHNCWVRWEVGEYVGPVSGDVGVAYPGADVEHVAG